MCKLAPVVKSQYWFWCFLAKTCISQTCALRVTAEAMEGQIVLKGEHRKCPSRWTDAYDCHHQDAAEIVLG